jgi:hypothetical protein
VIDPQFELLWRKIAESYQMVAADASKTIEFEHEKWRVRVERGSWSWQVVITVNDDVKPKPPTLIKP